MADPNPVTVKVAAPLPRITIQFCTQCKWMLRAAYLAQELLSTFSLSLGEVALQPSTGGTFIVTITHQPPASPSAPQGIFKPQGPSITSAVLWDRKVDGGFPETKELKRRVRDVIQPERDLGHVDRNYPAPVNKKDTLERGPGPVVGNTDALGSASEQTVGNTYTLGPNQRPAADSAATRPSDDAATTDGGAAAKCEDCT